MRPVRTSLPAAALGALLLLTACSGGDDETGADGTDPVTLQVAAVTSPMTDVVEAAGEAIADGYEIELVEVSDYVTSNVLLQAGDVYANFSQQVPYMQLFNEANDGDLVAVQPVYNFIVAFYSRTVSSIEETPTGATVAIPDDASNAGRALALLAEHDLVTIDPAVDPYDATLDDIVENPLQLQFTEVAISQLNTAYEEFDLVFQWPSHIAALGLTPQDDGLITKLDEQFVLNVVVREQDADSPATQALKDAFTSDEVREVIESNGTITVGF